MGLKGKAVRKVAQKATQGFIAKQEFNQLKKELRREANSANKKLRAMERNGMEGLPAYEQRANLKGGRIKPKFSTAGRNTQKEVKAMQKELESIKKFNNSDTGGVTKGRKYLQEMAGEYDIKYKNTKDLIAKTRNFWEVVSKLEQMYDDMKVIKSDEVVKEVKSYMEGNSEDLKNMAPEDIAQQIFEGKTERDRKNTRSRGDDFSLGGEPSRN